jgi:type IV pilus assembly protein PilQ
MFQNICQRMENTAYILITTALISLFFGCAPALHVRKVPRASEEVPVQSTSVRDIEYDVWEPGGTITAPPSACKPDEEAGSPPFVAKKEAVSQTVPRLFFAGGKAKLNRIIGVDFFMLPEGKSRITVITNNVADYEVSRKGPRTLVLHINEATIPHELTRYMDSSYFKGAVNRITPMMRVVDRRVEREIRLEFERTSVKPPVKRITPARKAEILQKREGLPKEPGIPIGVFHPHMPEGYTGARITLDIVNADVRNVLKLIGEVSGLNMVWGPEVKGTISLRLKDVPWDHALEIVLRATDLGIVVKQIPSDPLY